jgi:uncharacterized repeat protein (TIGR03803 family)
MKKRNISFYLFFLLFIQTADAQVPALYGMALAGGKYGGGAIIKVTGNPIVFDTLYSFDTLAGGYQPWGSLIASNGLLYGMTQFGGTHDFGVIFSFNLSNNIYTDLHDFNDSDGANPQGNLIQVNDSIFYGMTSAGGLPNYQFGVIFSFNPKNNIYKKIHTFINPDGITDTNGISPTGSLLQDGNKLYGLTSAGGDSTDGVIFSYNLSDSTYSKLYDFGDTHGIIPLGSLVKNSNGLLYGMTSAGGTFGGYGTIFSFDTSGNNYSDLYDFDGGANGGSPHGSLILAGGKLYGMTEYGGNNGGNGIIFSLDGNNKFDTLYDFNGITGSKPHGSLFLADGNLYGMTALGGNDTVGNIFSYNISGSVFTNIASFNDTLGAIPYGNLIDTSTVSGINQLQVIHNQLSIYPNPGNGMIIIVSSKNIDKLIVTNLLGQLIYVSEPKQTRCTLLIKDEGMYFVTVTSDNETATKNVIVVK